MLWALLPPAHPALIIIVISVVVINRIKGQNSEPRTVNTQTPVSQVSGINYLNNTNEFVLAL